MPVTIRVTCAMRDSNGCYNGPWNLGDPNNTFDIIFEGPCTIKICSGGLRTGGSATIEPGGHVIVIGGQVEVAVLVGELTESEGNAVLMPEGDDGPPGGGG